MTPWDIYSIASFTFLIVGMIVAGVYTAHTTEHLSWLGYAALGLVLFFILLFPAYEGFMLLYH